MPTNIFSPSPKSSIRVLRRVGYPIWFWQLHLTERAAICGRNIVASAQVAKVMGIPTATPFMRLSSDVVVIVLACFVKSKEGRHFWIRRGRPILADTAEPISFGGGTICQQGKHEDWDHGERNCVNTENSLGIYIDHEGVFISCYTSLVQSFHQPEFTGSEDSEFSFPDFAVLGS